jgi:16S rRNA processing protein RimM
VSTGDFARVTVARIVRTHGVRGEVAAEILTDFPTRLTQLTHADLRADTPRTPANGGRRVAIRSCRLTTGRGGQAIFHFEGYESIDEAKKLVGMEVQIPLADRVALPGGSYYVTDLIGCEVVKADGATLGRIRDVDRLGESVRGTPVLVVDTSSGELLIPFAQDICVNVDLAARCVTVELPEGLADLNAHS